MRIVGGRLRGRQIAAPADNRVRPTADRVRESLFDILSTRIDLPGIRVIDLFAGTGALGLEALSRGASFALFVEDAAASRALIRSNVEALGLEGCSRLYRRDATRLGAAGTQAPFDLAFADPPYGGHLGEKAALSLAAGSWLKPGALLAIEEAVRSAPEALPGFLMETSRRYGDVAITLFRYNGPAHDQSLT